jgi:hypothetical protein
MNVSRRDDREFSFEEWLALTRAEKRKVISGWNLKRPETGEETRAAILASFGESHPRLLHDASAGTAYFSIAGWSIVVVVTDPSVRVPRSFDVFPVIKGIADRSDGSWRSVAWQSR